MNDVWKPEDPELQQAYDEVKESALEGYGAWRESIRRGGETKLLAMYQAAFMAVAKIRAKHPWMDEEDLFTRAVEDIDPESKAIQKGIQKYSRAHFINDLIRKLEPKEASMPVLGVEYKNLEDSLAEGDDVIDPIQSEEYQIKNAVYNEMAVTIDYVLDTLTFREREIIKLRYGIPDGVCYTLEETGAIFKVTRTRIRQIEAVAMKKLQHPLRQAYLRPFNNLGDPRVISAQNQALNFLGGIALQERRERRSKLEERKAMKLYTKLEQSVGTDKAEQLYALFHGNPMGFISYVYKTYGIMPSKRSITKVTRLSEKARKMLSEVADPKFDNQREELFMPDPHCQSVIEQMSAREKESYDNIMADRVIDILMPVFIRDKKKVKSILQRAKKKGPNQVYTQAQQYFDSVDNLNPSGLKTELAPHQKADLVFMGRHPHRINANQMGCGKSLASLARFHVSGADKMLIIAPVSAALGVWPEEIEKHFEDPPKYAVLNNKDTCSKVKKLHAENKILIATYDAVRFAIDELVDLHFDHIAVDESHMIVNTETQRYKAMSALHAPEKTLISGTPFKNTRAELWGPLRWLCPDKFEMSWETYRTRYMHEEGLYRLAYELREIMIRRMKKDVLPNLPKVTDVNIDVHLSPYQKRKYQKLERQFVDWWLKQTKGNASSAQLIQGIALSKTHALRQYVLEPKIPLIPDLVREIHGRGEKVLIATTYVNAAGQIRKNLAPSRTCYIDGKVRGEKRAQEIRAFWDDPKKKTMIITEAGSQSLNLTPANNLINVNDPWTPAALDQRRDRIHRMGQTREVINMNMVTVGTIDERIRALLTKKRKEFDEVIDSSVAYLGFKNEEIKDLHALVMELAR